MHYDFSTVEDKDSFVSVPEGRHTCRVAEVRDGLARDGSVRWRFRLEVVDGDHAGRTAAWDSITWSERGIFRVKKVLEAFGFDVEGEVDVESGDLEGCTAAVQVEIEEWEDPLSGRRTLRNSVPYLGYARLEEAAPSGVDGQGGGDGSSAREPRGTFDDIPL